MHALRQNPLSPAAVEYPCSDGEPMADNTLQYQWIVTIQGGLDRELSDFVAGNILWYPVEGQPLIRIGPDVLVALGRPKGHRSSYLQWEEEGVAPHVIFEVLSPSNTRNEMHRKLLFYDRYAVKEYYVVDPYEGSIEVYRREGAHLSPVEVGTSWLSPLLGIRMETEGGIRLYHADGRRFLTFLELEEEAENHRKRAQQEAERADQEATRATQATERADQEAARATQAALRAAEAEARAEALAARLRALGVDPSAL